MALRNPERVVTEQELQTILQRIQGLTVLITYSDIAYILSPETKLAITEQAIEWFKTGEVGEGIRLERYQSGKSNNEQQSDLVDVAAIIHSLL